MLRAAAFALMLTTVASTAEAAECGTEASRDRIDAAANAMVRAAVLADAEGQPQAAGRFTDREGKPISRERLARLPRGWLAGPDPVPPEHIGVWSLNRSGLSSNAMLVQIGEGHGQVRVARRVHLRCRAGLWAIFAVIRHPEGDDLDDLLVGR